MYKQWYARLGTWGRVEERAKKSNLRVERWVYGGVHVLIVAAVCRRSRATRLAVSGHKPCQPKECFHRPPFGRCGDGVYGSVYVEVVCTQLPLESRYPPWFAVASP